MSADINPEVPEHSGDPGGESGWDRAKRRRRKRILEAARELLREDPDRGFTLPQLAERAGVAQATVFNLVGSRKAVWAAVTDDVLGGLDFAVQQTDPYQRARGIVDVVVDVIEEDPRVTRALILGWTDSGPALRSDPTHAFIRCFVEISDGATDKARHLGELMSTALIGGIHQWAAGAITTAQLRARLHLLIDALHAAATSDRNITEPGDDHGA